MQKRGRTKERAQAQQIGRVSIRAKHSDCRVSKENPDGETLAHFTREN